MPRQYMTLEDLYNYFASSQASMKFNIDDTDNKEPLVVGMTGTLYFDAESKDTQGLLPVHVKMNYVGDTLNKSRIKLKAQEAALSSSQHRPLLAYIHEVDGKPQFYGHNRHEENGEIVYDEIPVGVIFEQAHLEHDEEKDMDFAVANGYIWVNYSKAAEILEREQKCDVSVELAIRSLSYDAKDRILNLDDFYYDGCTMLGCDEEGNPREPAMPGSEITIASFSRENNSQFGEDKLNELLCKFNELFEKFNIQAINTEKGGKPNMEKFSELLAKYEKTAEDITFEYENLSDEELEKAFHDAFDSAESEQTEPEKVEFSMKFKEDVKTFSLSMNETIRALQNFVNEMYAGEDDYYSVDVYGEEKYVVMYSWRDSAYYRQSYEISDDDNISLLGERVRVYTEFLTKEESEQLKEIRSKYSVISDKLSKYESEPEKLSVLNSADYSQIAELDEFKTLKSQDKHFDMSVDEVKAEADRILLSFAKSNKLTFSVEDSTETSRRELPTTSSRTSRYGDLFRRYKDN